MRELRVRFSDFEYWEGGSIRIFLGCVLVIFVVAVNFISEICLGVFYKY